MEQELILRVTDLSRGGSGVAREPAESSDENGRAGLSSPGLSSNQGQVVFIPFTAPGDLVRVQIVHRERRFARGKLIEVLEPSPQRIEARCPAFGQCGGCQWQHISYDLQWKTKVNGVIEALKRVQVTPPETIDQIPAEKLWEYRNRIQLRGNATGIGYFEQGTRNLVPVNRCDIARPELNQMWPEIRQHGKFSESFKVEIEVNDLGQVKQSWNSPHHAAAGFRQIHDEQNSRLKEWIAQTISSRISKMLSNEVTLYDLFGGNGNLSLPLVSFFSKIHCVDVSSPQTRPLGVPVHFHFHRSPVLPWLTKNSRNTSAQALRLSQSTQSSSSSIAIIDPPREGLGKNADEIISHIEKLGVSEVIAVGCSVDEWAKDLSHWIGRDWILQKILMVDFFPQTPHIESVAVLSRSTGL